MEAIGDFAFRECVNIEKIQLPPSVNKIGTEAFRDCKGLMEVEIAAPAGEHNYNLSAFSGSGTKEAGIKVTYGEGTKDISDRFWMSSNLREVVIPEGVTTIGYSEFQNCAVLEKAKLPESLEKLGERAFLNCTSLSGTVTLPKGLTSLGNSAFRGCTHLEKAILDAPELQMTSYDVGTPGVFAGAGTEVEGGLTIVFTDNVTKVPDFYLYSNSGTETGSDGVGRVEFGKNIREIGRYAFYKCGAIKELTIPDKVETIGSYAFSGCTNITSIRLGKGLKDIQGNAFYNIPNLTTVMIPLNVEIVASSAFANCPNLTEFIVAEENENLSSKEGVLYDKEQTELLTYPAGKDETEFDILDTVETIGEGAFEGNNSLVSITIGDGVTEIADDAFANRNQTLTVWGYAGSYAQDYVAAHKDDMLEFDVLEPEADADTPVIKAATLQLAGTLVLNFFATVSEESESATMTFKVVGYDGNKTVETAEWDKSSYAVVNGQKWYRFSLPLSAKQMSDKVFVRLDAQVNGVKKSSINISYSIEKYCRNKLIGSNIGENTKLRNLLGAMLKYGTMSQNYFSYGLSHLPSGVLSEMDATQQEEMNESLESAQYSYDDMASKYAMRTETTEDAVVSIASVTLILESSISIRILVRSASLTPGDKLCFRVQNSDSVSPDTAGYFTDFKQYNNTYSYADIVGITAQNLDDMYEIFVADEAGEVLSDKLSYGAMTFAYRKWQDDQSTIGQLVRSMQVYNEMSEVYFK